MQKSRQCSIIVLALLLLLAGGAICTAASPAHADSCVVCMPDPHPEPGPTGYMYTYDGTSQAFIKIAGHSAPAEQYEYKNKPPCLVYQGNCAGQCETESGETGIPYVLFRRPFGSDEAFTSWIDICVGDRNTTSLEEVEESVHEELFARIDKPVANANPTEKAVVNLPVIFWTHSPDHIGFDVTAPVPGTLTATPTHTWTTSDGATLTGTGTAYDGTDPARDPDHYIHHVFTEYGAAWVNLTTTWNADFTVRGNGPIELDPITNRDRAEISVHEITPVLTGG